MTKPDQALHEIEIKLKLKFITQVMLRNSMSGGHKTKGKKKGLKGNERALEPNN